MQQKRRIHKYNTASSGWRDFLSFLSPFRLGNSTKYTNYLQKEKLGSPNKKSVFSISVLFSYLHLFIYFLLEVRLFIFKRNNQGKFNLQMGSLRQWGDHFSSSVSYSCLYKGQQKQHQQDSATRTEIILTVTDIFHYARVTHQDSFNLLIQPLCRCFIKQLYQSKYTVRNSAYIMQIQPFFFVSSTYKNWILTCTLKHTHRFSIAVSSSKPYLQREW